MDKLRVQVNGRGYYLKTDNQDEVLAFAKSFEEKILYIMKKMPRDQRGGGDRAFRASSDGGFAQKGKKR
ncbi:MAG: hypothetical protein K2N29_06610 [Ruminiclostridium sp.]|nr:hypothetical protein [Ruminiclostridium sp.]